MNLSNILLKPKINNVMIQAVSPPQNRLLFALNKNNKKNEIR